MKQIERIEKNLKELAQHDVKYSMFKTTKSWFLIYKDNNSRTEYIEGLNRIEKFVLNKCIELDETTGILVEAK